MSRKVVYCNDITTIRILENVEMNTNEKIKLLPNNKDSKTGFESMMYSIMSERYMVEQILIQSNILQRSMIKNKTNSVWVANKRLM